MSRNRLRKESKFQFLNAAAFLFNQLAANVLQLPEGGDFGAIHCQPSTNIDRST